MDDLIERLRSEYHLSQGDGYDALIKTGAEASDRITSLQQENERLREALEKADAAINAAFFQADAEHRGDDRKADQYDAIVRDGRAAIRAALSLRGEG